MSLEKRPNNDLNDEVDETTIKRPRCEDSTNGNTGPETSSTSIIITNNTTTLGSDAAESRNEKITAAIITKPIAVPEHLATKGIGQGSRLKVSWEVEKDGVTVPVWFTCILSECKGLDEQGRPLFTVNYEPLDEFEACTREVWFEDNGDMWDTVDKDYLRWAIEGQEDVINLTDVLAPEESEEEEEETEACEKKAMDEFEKLPHEKQTALAHGYRAFADHMKEKLRQLTESKGTDYVVTKEDIDGFVQELKSGAL